MKRIYALLLLSLAIACGDDDGSMADTGPVDGGMDIAADTSADTDDAGEDIAEDTTPSDVTEDSSTDGGVVTPQGRVIVGHLGGDSFQLHQFDAETFEATSGSPYTVPRAYNDIATHSGRGYIALTLPGSGEVHIVDGADLSAVETFSIEEALPLTVAFDASRDLLYVYSADGPSARFISVYDTSSTPFVELDASPFEVDVVGTQIEVDAETGNLVGISTSTTWVGRVNADAFELLFDGPISSGATGMALDSITRRFFTASGFPSRLRVYDLDSGDELAAIALPGDFPSGVSPDGEGGAFVLDGTPIGSSTPTTLHHVSAALVLEDTCGSADGCTIDTTETGMATDPSTSRLFVSVSRGEESAGELARYDVSDASAPSEVEPDTRPEVGVLPAWVEFY